MLKAVVSNPRATILHVLFVYFSCKSSKTRETCRIHHWFNVIKLSKEQKTFSNISRHFPEILTKDPWMESVVKMVYSRVCVIFNNLKCVVFFLQTQYSLHTKLSKCTNNCWQQNMILFCYSVFLNIIYAAEFW